MHHLAESLMTPNPMISCGTSESTSENKTTENFRITFSWHVFAVGERIFPLIFPSPVHHRSPQWEIVLNFKLAITVEIRHTENILEIKT